MKFISMGFPEYNLHNYPLPDAFTGNIPPSHYGTVEPEHIETEDIMLVKYDLSRGVHPFGPTRKYPSIMRLTTEEMILRMMDTSDYVDEKPAIDLLMEQHALKGIAYIAFGHLGSNEMLERIFTQMVHNHSWMELTKIVGIQPQFPQAEYFTRRHLLYDPDGNLSLRQVMLYEAFRDFQDEPRPTLASQNDLLGLQTPYDTKVERLARYYYHNPRENIIIYIDNPNSPTGGVAHPSTIRVLANACARFPRRLLVIDEAFADTLPDADSAMGLTEEFPNVIVTRTFSKGHALPEKAGYAAMSPLVGEQFARVKDTHGLRRQTQLIVNEILKPENRTPHLAEVGDKIEEAKHKFIGELRQFGDVTSPSDDRVPILYFDGGDPYFQQRLRMEGIKTASGFTAPFYDAKTGTHQPITSSIFNLPGRCVRMTIPANMEDIPKIVSIIRNAIEGRPVPGQRVDTKGNLA